MKKIVVIVEKADNNYSAYLEQVGGVIVTGDTLSEIKENMYATISVLKEDCEEFGGEFPSELAGEFDLVFKPIE